ncbi:MAG TPA: hypothetical protein VIO61_13040 [Anaerolineaceae bacterium]
MVTNLLRRSEINFWNTYDYLINQSRLRPVLIFLIQVVLVKRYRITALAIGSSALCGLLCGYILFLITK